MKILVLLSDMRQADNWANALRGRSWHAEVAHDLDDAKSILTHGDFDVLLLDHDLLGVTAIHRLRVACIKTPLVYLTGHSATMETQVDAFNAGADDVWRQGLDIREAEARLAAVVRRDRGQTSPRIRIGQVELDMQSCTVAVSQVQVHLTGKEYSLLEVLMRRAGQVLSKEVLFDHVYGGRDEPDGIKIIDVFVCKLRKKLRLAGADDFVRTVWGRGYQVDAAG